MRPSMWKMQTKDELNKTKDKLNQIENGMRVMLRNLINLCKQTGLNEEKARKELEETYKVDKLYLNLFFEEYF